MKNFLLIDGNSIMNRAFYGIMSSNLMQNKEGKYTNALYGFLSILFKNIEEVKPDFLLVAFDSKTAANVRKEQYSGYKQSRHKMPEELAEQMPEIKEILKAMKIETLELADFEGDDILGSAAKKYAGASIDGDKINCYILSGDRDLFQLVQKDIIVRIPRTKMGKTETDIYDLSKIDEEYGLTPCDLIEVKALQGDSSDEIPGCPGIGPKSAIQIIKEFKTIDNLYDALDGKNEEFAEKVAILKPKQKENLLANREQVFLSRIIGTIKLNAPITDDLTQLKYENWNNPEVFELFKYYGFKRFIERFGLTEGETSTSNNVEASLNKDAFLAESKLTNKEFKDVVLPEKELVYYLVKEKSLNEEKIIKKEITGLGVIEKDGSISYIEKPDLNTLKAIFENEQLDKIGYNLSEDYVLLKEMGITLKNIAYDIEVASYDIDPTNTKHSLNEIAEQYLDIDIDSLIPQKAQIDLFSTEPDFNPCGIYVRTIYKLFEITKAKLEEAKSLDLFNKIEIPLITVLGEIQFNGMHCDASVLENFGKELKDRITSLSREIYEIAGEEFNINSPKQLGDILFEKLGIPSPKKKKKSGAYSTDVDTLEKIKFVNPIVEKILEYRGISKLNSTYVEGLIPTINPKDKRIHSYFHQTITATGRISSTEPNLQNIPAREELGRNIKKAFIAEEGYSFIDADYSQVELRVLASMSGDENMIKAFTNGEDIHKEVASQVFNVPLEEVTKEQRSKAKAVNFGIVYGITGFGLAEQIGVSRKEAQNYIDNYLLKFSKVDEYMHIVVDKAKKDGFVETLFGRRRYINELKSSNFMVREFGKRAAMNTPIQGTAADIMKIAMNNVYKELKESNLNAKIVLQVHDELLLEVKDEDVEKAEIILKRNMENAFKLNVPLMVETNVAKTWYDVK